MGFMTPFNKVGYLFPGRFWVAAWGGCGPLILQGTDTFESMIFLFQGGYTPPKANMDTQNDDVEKVPPFE